MRRHLKTIMYLLFFNNIELLLIKLFTKPGVLLTWLLWERWFSKRMSFWNLDRRSVIKSSSRLGHLLTILFLDVLVVRPNWSKVQLYDRILQSLPYCQPSAVFRDIDCTSKFIGAGAAAVGVVVWFWYWLYQKSFTQTTIVLLLYFSFRIYRG